MRMKTNGITARPALLNRSCRSCRIYSKPARYSKIKAGALPAFFIFGTLLKPGDRDITAINWMRGQLKNGFYFGL